MSEVRKTPEEILAEIEEETASRGRLKIFLGACAGVGKTFTMLEDARQLVKGGVDVIGGVVVTHGRKETEALIEGLSVLPLKAIEYKTTALYEFDLDAALARKPEVCLVDELAHTNVPGSRHEKRWQDVEELLQAGIDVLTTVNVQHVESVNDVVAQITGVQVRETVPDSILEKADEIELVDLPPDDLLERLKEGKIYLGETAQSALEHFFKKGNLMALRELALRLTAERVDAEMRKYRQTKAVQDVWPTTGRILVCVGPSPLSARLVRATKRMAVQLRAEWKAAYVETPNSVHLSERDRQRVSRTLRLARLLGAETCSLFGSSPAAELVSYARRINASHIVIGKPDRPRWREIMFGSVVDELIRQSGNIDVYVISGEPPGASDHSRDTYRAAGVIRWRDYFFALMAVVIATGISALSSGYLENVNLVMFYLLAVVIVGLNFGFGPSIVVALASVAAFDFFFVPPHLSFAIADTQYLITFAVMLVIGLTVSHLTSTMKQQEQLARKREQRTSALYAMTREQAKVIRTADVVDVSVRHIAEIMESRVVLWLVDKDMQLVQASHDYGFVVDHNEIGVAQWVLINKQSAGAGTSTLSGARAMYIPLLGTHSAVGVIGLFMGSYDKLSLPDELNFFETVCNLTALAVERAQLGEQS